jgi:DNA polymerase III subunit alpha
MKEEKTELLKHIDKHIIEGRYSQVDLDFLEYEISMSSTEDISRIYFILTEKATLGKNWTPWENPYNSILLYIVGITDTFDFKKARSEMTGGAPPDIDIDHDALDREVAIQWCVDYWGRDKVANIITHGTFKPKSLARSFYRITEGDQDHLTDLLGMIPPPKYGKEATLTEILETNPSLETSYKYKSFLEFADRIENMVANFGIHAAGIIISDKDISETVPLWKNSKAERITQYDKDECEELGLIKFDFLGIDTLSVIKECVKLVKENKGVELSPYAIEDGDEATYQTLAEGKLTGVFQMETSGIAKRLIFDIKPKSIEDLSAISAINRPGPLQAGLDKQYIENKINNTAPDHQPEKVAEILKTSYWTLIYQEQILALFTELAGFDPKTADDIRRAMGKKKLTVLEVYEPQFILGCQKVGGLTAEYAADLWMDILGFADYCLAGDTKVFDQKTGAALKIKDIVDYQLPINVLSCNKNKTKMQQASQWHKKGKKEIYRYYMEDKSFVDCTAEHNFLSENLTMVEIDRAYSDNIELLQSKGTNK